MSIGIALQQRGIDAAISHNPQFTEDVVGLIRSYEKDKLFTFDFVRKDVVLKSLGTPKHPNCWGAVLNKAIKEGLICETGRRFASDIPSNHGRKLQEYKRT